MTRALLGIAGVVLAFVLARLTVEPDPVHVTATPSAPTPVAFTPTTPPPRVEVAPRQDPAPAQVHVARAAPTAGQQARSLVERAVAGGRWSDTDRVQLGHLLGSLSEQEAQVVLGRLVTAINAGKLAVETTPL